MKHTKSMGSNCQVLSLTDGGQVATERMLLQQPEMQHSEMDCSGVCQHLNPKCSNAGSGSLDVDSCFNGENTPGPFASAFQMTEAADQDYSSGEVQPKQDFFRPHFPVFRTASGC